MAKTKLRQELDSKKMNVFLYKFWFMSPAQQVLEKFDFDKTKTSYIL
jgi:hypothetical protein